MDVKVRTLFVILGLFIFGFCMALYISFMNCGKISTSISAMEGFIWAIFPSIAYYVGTSYEFIRQPFSEQLGSPVWGLAWLMMIVSWVMTTVMIDRVVDQVCKPTLDELKKFQEDLAKELKEKEDASNINKPTS
jgi:hypothetical protein